MEPDMDVAGRGTGGPLGSTGSLALTDAEQAALLGAAAIVSFAPDSTIYRQGDPAEHVYLLARGLARASRLLHDGRRQLVAFLWPDDIFGLAEEGRYLNSLEAVTEIAARRIPLAALEKVLRSDARLSLEMAIRTAHELRVAQGHILCLGQLDVPRRIARFLLDCADHADLFDAAAARLSLPMRRQDVADYLGTSVEAVARGLTRLEGAGLIRRLSRRDILIPDMTTLGGFAERDPAPN